MFLFLRHGALLTIVETKAQYEDALANMFLFSRPKTLPMPGRSTMPGTRFPA